MAILLGDMLPPEERIAMGLSLQRMSIDYSAKESEGNTYTFILVKESGQTFQFQNVDFRDGICPIVQIDIGSLHVTASLTSWKEIITDIGGKSIYTVVLVQYASIFLKPIAITEAFRVPPSFIERGAIVDASGILQEPFLYQSTLWISTTLVNGKVFGPSIKSIFKALDNASFSMGGTNTTFNFDGLLVDSDAPDLITMHDGGTTLFDVIKDYSKINNFEYKLIFKRIASSTIILSIPTTVYVTEISFLKTGITDETSHLAEGFLNVFDALTKTHEGEIINSEQGFSVAKDFKQNAEFVTKINKDDKGNISYDTDTYTITHPGILGYADFGEKTKISVIRGGPKSDFLNFTASDIHQFWGFTSSGTLSEAPDDLNKMDKILNNQDIIDEDTDLREFMNLWGRQFVVNSTHLTQLEPLTPEQEEAIAKEEQAMTDLVEVLLLHFNSLPIRQLGDSYRNGVNEVNNFLIQYNSDHPEILDQPTSIFGGLSNFRRAFSEGSEKVVLEPQPNSLMETFDRELNSTHPHYPSVDEILVIIEEKNLDGTRLPLDSTQISLEKARTNVVIPESVQARSMCFPSIDHPLANISKARANWRASDGRWPAYIQLPPLPKSTSGTQYNWASKIISTINHVEADKKHYIRVDVRQLNNYYIITLPGQLLQIQSSTNKEGGPPEIILKIRNRIESAYVPSEDTKKLYGPFIVSEGKLLDENNQKFIDILSDSTKFQVDNIIRDILVPEAFSKKGTFTKDESLEEMKNFILKNYQSLNARLVWAHRFGSLTVAGLPVEEAYNIFVFPDGATVNRVSINFGIDGIKTTYYVDSPDQEDLKDVKVKQPEPHEDKEEEPQKIKNEEPKIDEPKLESDPKQNTLSDTEKEDIPKGGQGRITGRAFGPGSYTVEKLDSANLSSFGLDVGLGAVWSPVYNISETFGNSPGYLLPGTIVNVQVWKVGITYRYYMEHSPEVFAPPLPDE